jgi:hypothetical protein
MEAPSPTHIEWLQLYGNDEEVEEDNADWLVVLDFYKKRGENHVDPKCQMFVIERWITGALLTSHLGNDLSLVLAVSGRC